MRVLVLVALVLVGCGDPPPQTPHDPTTDASYGKTVEELAATTRAAETDFQSGKSDDAAALIEKGEPLASQILAVPHPTLAAMEAAGDLDSLYGRMLVSNQHYEWAEFLFQKNQARWKHWTPATPETARRLQEAEAAIAECDRQMLKSPAKKSAKKSTPKSK